MSLMSLKTWNSAKGKYPLKISCTPLPPLPFVNITVNKLFKLPTPCVANANTSSMAFQHSSTLWWDHGCPILNAPQFLFFGRTQICAGTLNTQRHCPFS